MRCRKLLFSFTACVALVSSPYAMANEQAEVINTIAKQNAVIQQRIDLLSPEQISLIKAEPTSLLRQFPAGGPFMARYVAQAAITSSSIVENILEASLQANPDQASAIGAGLARAARSFPDDSAKNVSSQVSKSAILGTQISYNAIGPKFKADFRIYPEPVKIGMFDTANGNINLNSTDDRGVIGSNKLTSLTGFEFGGLSPELQENLLNTALFDGTALIYQNFENPWFTVGVIASDAEDNGTTSTSPTQ